MYSRERVAGERQAEIERHIHIASLRAGARPARVAARGRWMLLLGGAALAALLAVLIVAGFSAGSFPPFA
jgi:hypothetical protein